MKIVIAYDSATGNTEYLARVLAKTYPQAVCAPVGEADWTEADVVLLGFWTDKGNCSAKLQERLPELAGKEVFLFGTAGFGASQDYFEQIVHRIQGELPDSCQVIGWYMCAGQMPETVRLRYADMAKDPEMGEKGRAMLKIYDAAVGHPDAADAEQMIAKVQALLNK